MRFKTLVLIPLVALLGGSAVHVDATTLPASQNQISANEAPQKVKLVVKTTDTDITRANAASRSAKRYAFGTPNYNKQFAGYYMQDKYNWGSKQHSCLVKLWNRESGWRTYLSPCQARRWHQWGLIGKQTLKHKSSGV